MQSTTSFRDFKNREQNNYSESHEYKVRMQSVKETLGILDQIPWNLSMYKVPNKLRRLKEDAYNPHLVSIGPFHASNYELVAMKEHKWRYMLYFLCRAAPHGTNYGQGNEHPSVKALEECGKAISELEEVARACYAQKINFDKHDLVDILLVDGCFILELFIRYADPNQDQDEEEEELDPIINSLWMVPTLRHDLALLENQIPFAVLHILFDTIKKFSNKQFRFSLEEYALRFFRPALNLSVKAIEDTREHREDLLHIADLLHRVYTPTSISNPKGILEHPNWKVSTSASDEADEGEGQEKIEWGFERSATQLVESGIQFKPGVDKDRRLLDITFDEGVITIPPLYIKEITDSIFRNLVAFEQCHVGCSPHIASYARLMKTLIRSSQDAKLLKQKGIIKTDKVGDDQEVKTFFESLCREVVVKDFCFSDLCEKVNEYGKSWLHWGRIKAAVKVRWNGYIVTLQNDYFKSPWTIISFFAAFVILCLTVLGTCYTVLSYYPH